MQLTQICRAIQQPVALAAFGVGTLLVLILGLGGTAAADAHHGEFNHQGNILISDQFNNRVIEIDRDHDVIWQFGSGSNVARPDSIVGVNDAQRVGDQTLMAGTGVPAASPPLEPGCDNGCPDNRVILVDRHGRIVWQYGQAGVTGSGPNQLNTPVQCTYLPNGHILITDQGNERVIEVNRGHHIVWQYGQTGTIGAGADQLNNPNSAELLANGHILIADENNNRAIEVNRDHQIVWHYGEPPPAASPVSGVAFASRLANGHTLITDSNNNRVVEVDRSARIVWTYVTNTRPGSMPNPLPTRAVRLRNGDTLISDQFNNQVIEVNRQKEIVFTQGVISDASAAFDRLNAPYDAKVVGDYTGLTPPFGDDGDNPE